MNNILNQGKSLTKGNSLTSANGLYSVTLQQDGNLCVRQKVDSGDGFLWGSMQLTSDSCYLTMQGDGNLCVYRGTPGDGGHNLLWASMGKSLPGADYCLIMQDDGYLCVYNSSTVFNSSTWVWNADGGSGKANGVNNTSYDPVVNVTNVSNMVYDLSNVTRTNASPASLASVMVTNNTGTVQHQSRQLSTSVTDTSSWSNTIGVSVSVTTSFKVGIPIIADGKVEVSASASNDYSWGKETSTTTNDTFTADVDVPAHTSVVAVVAATKSMLTVPYTATGTYVYQSGRTYTPKTIAGTYTGSSTHDYSVTYSTPTGQQVQGTLSYQDKSGKTVKVAAQSSPPQS